MMEKSLTVLNTLGLHARAAARLVSLAMTFESNVALIHDGKSVNAKSMLGVMSLELVQHSTVTVRVDGNDETAAMDSIEALFNGKFGEYD
jgi:phosphotransferase system HPr (HPr) family protein